MQYNIIKGYARYSLLCYSVLVQDIKSVSRVICTWKKFRELSGMLVGTQGLSLKQQGKYEDDLAATVDHYRSIMYTIII